jgi:hypothetical protein
VALLWTSTGAIPNIMNTMAWGFEHPVWIYGHYGIGGFIDDIAGHPRYHLDGVQLGYRADFMLCPDQKIGIIVMGDRGKNERFSYGSDEFYVHNMVPDLMNILLGAR